MLRGDEDGGRLDVGGWPTGLPEGLVQEIIQWGMGWLRIDGRFLYGTCDAREVRVGRSAQRWERGALGPVIQMVQPVVESAVGQSV